MSAADLLTLSRIASAFLLMFLLSHGGIAFKTASFILFLLASLTDYWDGKLARAQGLSTHFGKLMDPIADKFLVLAAFLSFVQLGLVPAWMTAVVVTRDLLVTGFRLFVPLGHSAQGVRKSGKHKTALQMILIFFVLGYLVLAETPFWHAEWEPFARRAVYTCMLFVVFVTVWSGVRFFIKNKDALDAILGQ